MQYIKLHVPFIAARIIGSKGDFPFVPFTLEMRWTSFGTRLSKRFSARAAGKWEWLTMLSKHSLLVFTPNLGSPIIAVNKIDKIYWWNSPNDLWIS